MLGPPGSHLRYPLTERSWGAILLPLLVIKTRPVRIIEKEREVVFYANDKGELSFKETKITTNINNQKTVKTMATKKIFRTIGTGVHYMFNEEMQSLVQVELLSEVFNLHNGMCIQRWRVADMDKVMETHYEPATEEEPEKFFGKVYKTLEAFENDKPMTIEELFMCDQSEKMVCDDLYRGRPSRCVRTDDSGAYIWIFDGGQAVKWYFKEHMSIVRWVYSKKGQIEVTCDYDGKMPEPYYDAEEVYKYNDYRCLNADGTEEVHEGFYKRLFLEPDQQKLAEKLQGVIDECEKAGMTIYWSNADYTLNAINVRHVDRIEYEPEVNEETEQVYDFDDSRCSHVFKNVTDLNSEGNDIRIVVKR